MQLEYAESRLLQLGFQNIAERFPPERWEQLVQPLISGEEVMVSFPVMLKCSERKGDSSSGKTDGTSGTSDESSKLPSEAPDHKRARLSEETHVHSSPKQFSSSGSTVTAPVWGKKADLLVNIDLQRYDCSNGAFCLVAVATPPQDPLQMQVSVRVIILIWQRATTCIHTSTSVVCLYTKARISTEAVRIRPNEIIFALQICLHHLLAKYNFLVQGETGTCLFQGSSHFCFFVCCRKD